MTHRDEVWGDEGDAEYHTTAHEERAEFYANATTIRDVSGKKATSDMVVGQLVCRYGRSSNLMTCNHEVNLLNAVTYDPNCPCFIRNLVRATNPSSAYGDSGGPYFRGYTAWGIHHGKTSSSTYFMPIEEVEDALDVTLKTK